MASDDRKESGSRPRNRPVRGGPGESTPPSGLPEFVRRALAAGFSGFFLTGEALREALGDSLPREWADFASDQSARARKEFIERLSFEMGRAVEGIDWAEVLARLLEGRTLEVSARIRLGERDETAPPTLRIKLEE
jgi:hypothetical protein